MCVCVARAVGGEQPRREGRKERGGERVGARDQRKTAEPAQEELKSARGEEAKRHRDGYRLTRQRTGHDFGAGDALHDCEAGRHERASEPGESLRWLAGRSRAIVLDLAVAAVAPRSRRQEPLEEHTQTVALPPEENSA